MYVPAHKCYKGKEGSVSLFVDSEKVFDNLKDGLDAHLVADHMVTYSTHITSNLIDLSTSRFIQ